MITNQSCKKQKITMVEVIISVNGGLEFAERRMDTINHRSQLDLYNRKKKKSVKRIKPNVSPVRN
jgi:hypothetical protein